MSGNRNHDAFDEKVDEVTLEDSIEEFNYSMQRILNHDYIWEEFMNDLKINSTRNLHPLTKSETYTWKKKPYQILRFVCAFTLSGIQKAEEEGQTFPMNIEKFKCAMKHSDNVMTVHDFMNGVMADMNIIIIRNFSGTVAFEKNDDSMYAEEVVTVKEESNKAVAI